MTQNGATEPLLGQLVADRYRLLEVRGEGGIGKIFRARHELLERDVALKVLHPEFSAREEMNRRFVREAQAQSTVVHPNAVSVYDFGTWEGRLFMVMELVEGPSLEKLIRESRPFAVETIIKYAMQICDGLEAGHQRGVLHRDLKPENVLVSRNSRQETILKLCDYGLAFHIEEEGVKPRSRITLDGALTGTPNFMSPEQILNKPLDGRSDIYALGCLLYEMIVGEPPFVGQSPMDILTKHLYNEPEAPSRRTTLPVSSALESLVLWCLRKSPEARPQTVRHLREALQLLLEVPAPLPDARLRTERSLPIPTLTRSPTSQLPATAIRKALVIEPPNLGVVRSLAVNARSQGWDVRSQPEWTEPTLEEMVIIDLRHEAAAMRDLWLQRCKPIANRTIWVGSDEDFEWMRTALEAKMADFIAEGAVSSLVKRLERMRARYERVITPTLGVT